MDVQIILESFFDIPNQKSINEKKPILLVHDSPMQKDYGIRK